MNLISRSPYLLGVGISGSFGWSMMGLPSLAGVFCALRGQAAQSRSCQRIIFSGTQTCGGHRSMPRPSTVRVLGLKLSLRHGQPTGPAGHTGKSRTFITQRTVPEWTGIKTGSHQERHPRHPNSSGASAASAKPDKTSLKHIPST